MRRWLLTLCFLCLDLGFSQVVDTLNFIPGTYTLTLSQPPIRPESVHVFEGGKLVYPDSINPVTGTLHFSKSPSDSVTLIVAYQTLSGIIPNRVGPLVNTLLEWDPSTLQIDTTVISKDKDEAETLDASDETLVSSGTFFRNFELSPNGGNGFSGGLELQLQGNLTKDITVSGILSDQNFPIQPEGNTQALEEIDKVYLDITHPNFQIRTGDLDIDIKTSRFANVSRKVTGMTGEVHTDSWTGNALIAGNGGIYTTYAFKGQDQNQGPYALPSKDGRTPIFILAGSERVWVDGQRRVRGENRDYIIDYSTGEITFMSRILIHDDTDILVEYEYRDGKYSRGLTGARINHAFGSGVKVGFQWIRDGDNIPAGTLSAVDREALTDASGGFVIQSTAIQDSTGSYVFNGQYYVYDPDGQEPSATRYRITFEVDPDSGVYRREISTGGRIYYTYVPDSLRSPTLVLYSPWRRISAPERLDFLTIQSSGLLGATGTWDFTWHGSIHDLNRLSANPSGETNGMGASFRAQGELRLFNQLYVHYAVEDWFRSARFAALSNDREARFYRNWNLVTIPTGEEHLSTFRLGIEESKTGTGQLAVDRYAYGTKVLYRLTGNVNTHSQWMPRLNLSFAYLDQDRDPFYQTNLDLAVLPTKIRPVFRYSTEQSPQSTRFESVGAGIESQYEQHQFRLGVDRRLDWTYQDSSFQREATDWITAVDWTARSKSGWRLSFNGTHRWKEKYITSTQFKSTMGQLQFSYHNPTRSVLWNWSSRLEEAQVQTRAVVYDSVGPGLGQYRYDPVFQEYVADPNGAYIGTVVFTGDRHPAVSMDWKQRLEIRNLLQNRLNLQTSRLVLDLASKFQGKTLSLDRLFSSDLATQQTQLSKGAINQDWDISFKAVPLRLREWTRSSLDFEGLDPRGNDRRRQAEWGIESQYALTSSLKFTTELSRNRTNTESTVSTFRNRSSNSRWIEPGLKFSRTGQFQIETRLRYAEGQGNQNQGDYRVTGQGLFVEGSLFPGRNHRIQGQMDWFQSQSDNSITELPSDALKGYALGRSFRWQLQSVWMLGNNFHLNLSVNYIDNAYYDGFIHFSGEIRAYY